MVCEQKLIQYSRGVDSCYCDPLHSGPKCPRNSVRLYKVWSDIDLFPLVFLLPMLPAMFRNWVTLFKVTNEPFFLLETKWKASEDNCLSICLPFSCLYLLTRQLTTILNLWSSFFCLQSAGFADVFHYIQFMPCWGWTQGPGQHTR